MIQMQTADIIKALLYKCEDNYRNKTTEQEISFSEPNKQKAIDCNVKLKIGLGITAFICVTACIFAIIVSVLHNVTTKLFSTQ